MRQRVLALLTAMVSALALALFLPASLRLGRRAAPAAGARPAVYTGGATASYNGHNWSAKWWTQDETPGTTDVWADQGVCGGARTPAGAGELQLPDLGAGRNYVTGNIVRYTDGKYYLAEHDNPGYDPVDQHLVLGARTPAPARRRPPPPGRPAASSSARPSSTRCSRAGTPSTPTPV